jgi:hypothetical protein
MYIVLFLLIVIISSILSFITSGVEHIFRAGDKDWYMIPLGYYFLAYSVLLFVIYKLKFKTPSIFKFFLLRNLSKLNSIFSKLETKVYDDKVEINSMQQKSIQSWNTLLKDPTTFLNSNLLTYTRFIQKGTLLIILKNRTDINLTVMDTSKRSLYYQVFIPQKYADEMSILFDRELDKRMNSLESKKRTELESVISSII